MFVYIHVFLYIDTRDYYFPWYLFTFYLRQNLEITDLLEWLANKLHGSASPYLSLILLLGIHVLIGMRGFFLSAVIELGSWCGRYFTN